MQSDGFVCSTAPGGNQVRHSGLLLLTPFATEGEWCCLELPNRRCGGHFGRKHYCAVVLERARYAYRQHPDFGQQPLKQISGVTSVHDALGCRASDLLNLRKGLIPPPCAAA